MMRSPKIFEAEYNDFVFMADNGYPALGPQVVVIVSGATEEIRQDFGIQKLQEVLQQLETQKIKRLALAEEMRKKFPDWHDTEGNYIPQDKRNAVAH